VKVTRTRKGIRMLAGAALALSCAGLLAGCGAGSNDADRPAPPSPSGTALDESRLGASLERIVYSGAVPKAATDGGACLVEKVKATEISDDALAFLAGLETDDKGAAVTALAADVSKDDSALFGSVELRQAFDLCVDAAFGNQASHRETTSPKPGYSAPPDPRPNTPTRKPHLAPKYTVDADITSASQLEKGVVSMLSSYAIDQEQKELFVKADSCLADVVFEAGFSQPSLKFLAGGAALGAGSIAAYLASSDDKKLWSSPTFTTKLSDCMEEAATVQERDQSSAQR